MAGAWKLERIHVEQGQYVVLTYRDRSPDRGPGPPPSGARSGSSTPRRRMSRSAKTRSRRPRSPSGCESCCAPDRDDHSRRIDPVVLGRLRALARNHRAWYREYHRPAAPALFLFLFSPDARGIRTMNTDDRPDDGDQSADSSKLATGSTTGHTRTPAPTMVGHRAGLDDRDDPHRLT